MYAGPAEEVEAQLVAGEGDDIIVGDRHGPVGCRMSTSRGRMAERCGVGIGFNAAFFYSIFNIRFYPIFYALTNSFAFNNHCHFRTFAPGFERGVNGGVAGATTTPFASHRSGLLVIVSDLGQVFTGDVHAGPGYRRSRWRG